MRRRAFLSLLGGAAAWPMAARAQQAERIRRVGVLMPFGEDDAEFRARLRTFEQALREAGWSAGRNIEFAYRFAEGRNERLPALAAELGRLDPDVAFVNGTPALMALSRQTSALPIVFANVADPVRIGVVASLAHPGGRITGFTNYEYAMGGKWLELLRDVEARLGRVLVILSPDNPIAPGLLRAIEAAAASLGVKVATGDPRDLAGLAQAIDASTSAAKAGIVVLPDFSTTFHRDGIIRLGNQRRIPGIYPFRYFVSSGGLMSYGVDSNDIYRRAAAYVDRILRGEKPANLPVQAPTKFELAINLKTAKALGLAVPPTLLARADEVIE
jgi:putative ABC transport system substrate-binding protein